jgi:flagellar hook-length control protein FliK
VVPPAPAAAWLAAPAAVAYQVRTEAGAAAEAAAPPPVPADIGPFAGAPHEQIVRAIRLQWTQGIGEAHLRLSPAHLGEVTIRLRVEQGMVTASLRGESTTAIDRIRAHEADLRAALEEQGLTLDSLELVVDPDGRRRGRHPADRFFEPAPSRRADTAGSTFEVTA